jgi:glyoxylase-like metal-dependent hydrolase (beta-lactamase superfamily II)
MPQFATRAASLLTIAALALVACSKKDEAPPPPAAEPAKPAVAEVAPKRSENVYQFTIGQLTAYALRDGGMEVPNDNKVFGVGQTPEAVAAVLSAAGQPTDKMALSIQPLLVKTQDKVLLFDTGASGNFGPGSGHLLASFTEAGLDPETVTDIFISHLHGDHVGGLLNPQGGLAFPNATVHLTKAEWDFMQTLKDDVAKNIGLENHAVLVAAIKPKVDAFAAGAELVPGVVKAVDIKGHTPGHSGYLVTSGPDSLLYVGDTVHQFVVSVAKPEWTVAFDHDAKVASRSRADLIAKSAADGQRIYAVHFPFPGLGKFEKRGEGYVWAAE